MFPTQLLPSGLVVPGPSYLLALAVAGVAVGWVLVRRRPAVTQRTVAAYVPWMAAGASFHALYQIRAAPTVVTPFLGAPTVYATTFVIASAVWAVLLIADAGRTDRSLAGVGTLATLLGAAVVLAVGATRGRLAPLLPGLALIASVVVAAGAVLVVRRVRPTVTEQTGTLGAVVVFGHVLDGISTAVGVDLLGTGERSPLPRLIMDFAAGLPTEPLLGSGWLFVVVKLVIAVAVLGLFAEFVAEEPVQGSVGLGFIAAVGLGPGVHNLLLFAAAGPV